jgi:hypothetical protein
MSKNKDLETFTHNVGQCLALLGKWVYQHSAKNGYQTILFVHVLMGLALLSSCSTTFSSKMMPHRHSHVFARQVLSREQRTRLASIAQQALGKAKLSVGQRTFRSDCSGTIRAIFAKASLTLGGIIKHAKDNDVKAIYRWLKKYGKITKENPHVGDLVFFHNTYDRSRNGRMDDALTHVGIVERIDKDTIQFIHHLGRSIIRSRMNLRWPKQKFHPVSRKRINHLLRRAQGGVRAFTAAELFAGFGRP